MLTQQTCFAGQMAPPPSFLAGCVPQMSIAIAIAGGEEEEEEEEKTKKTQARRATPEERVTEKDRQHALPCVNVMRHEVHVDAFGFSSAF